MKIKLLILAVLTTTVSSLSLADAGDVTTLEFTGSITRPTCVINLAKNSIELPKLATTAFTGKGSTAGNVPFTINIEQTAANGAVKGAACPSVSVSSEGAANTQTPNVKFSMTDADLAGEKQYLANKSNTTNTIAIQILNNAGEAIDFNDADSNASAYTEGALTYSAQYIALSNDVAEQDVTAALNFSVIYK